MNPSGTEVNQGLLIIANQLSVVPRPRLDVVMKGYRLHHRPNQTGRLNQLFVCFNIDERPDLTRRDL